jgi:hypothetical protein
MPHVSHVPSVPSVLGVLFVPLREVSHGTPLGTVPWDTLDGWTFNLENESNPQ